MHSYTGLLMGFILDQIIGDPKKLWHPVMGIGKLIEVIEGRILKPCKKNPNKEMAAGALLVFLVLIVCGGIPALMLAFAYSIHPYLAVALEAIFTWQILAAKSLKTAGEEVYRALKEGGLSAGRRAVAQIVGRDTMYLSEEGIIKATVETIAENTADGVIAPLFYLCLGGPVLGFIYKGINTMDSMVAYHNERYEYFGKVAACLDDVANFLPSRIAALLMVAASFVLGLDGKNAWTIFCRDRYAHKSPNSAQTESVMAGALNVKLAGDAWYFGKKVEKPTIGDAGKEVEMEDILRANSLLYGTTYLAILLTMVFKIIVGK